ncbi:MAG: hypothetical protein L0H24_07685 [Microlunatus sp.]|nr:hypothetical protein [Microlunatus sp.]
MARVYARPSWQLAAQVTSDVFVVVWAVVCALLARLVHSVVTATATPARESAKAIRGVSGDLEAAADKLSGLPGLGPAIRQPFDNAARRLDGLTAAADHQVAVIERAALVLGWSTFLIPVLLVVAVWLPARVRFVVQARAAERFRGTEAGVDLLAIRAIATQPLQRLGQISTDPIHAWRSRDTEVIAALAALELRRTGLPDSPPVPPGSPRP